MRGLVLPVGILLVWQLAVMLFHISEYKLPSPWTILTVLFDFAFNIGDLTPYSGTLLLHLAASLRRVFSGFALAAALGVSLGVLTGWFASVRSYLDPFIHLIRSVPGIGWLPVAIVWFGVGEVNTLFLISLAAFFPIYVNTLQGIVTIPEIQIRAARMLGARGMVMIHSVVIPAAFLQIFTGLRVSLGIAWSYLVLGEITGVTEGLGAVMTDGRMLGHVDIVLAAMIVIAVCGKLSDFLLTALCKKLYPPLRKKERH